MRGVLLFLLCVRTLLQACLMELIVVFCFRNYFMSFSSLLIYFFVWLNDHFLWTREYLVYIVWHHFVNFDYYCKRTFAVRNMNGYG